MNLVTSIVGQLIHSASAMNTQDKPPSDGALDSSCTLGGTTFTPAQLMGMGIAIGVFASGVVTTSIYLIYKCIDRSGEEHRRLLPQQRPSQQTMVRSEIPDSHDSMGDGPSTATETNTKLIYDEVTGLAEYTDDSGFVHYIENLDINNATSHAEVNAGNPNNG